MATARNINTALHLITVNNRMRCAAYKVAPEDGLIYSETCRAYNGK